VHIHQLTDDECDAVLRRSNLGRLGCARDNQPSSFPSTSRTTSSLRTPDTYSFANLGQKIEWMRTNPLVCVEVDEVTDNLKWTSVIAFGRFEELSQVDHPEAADRAYDLLHQRPIGGSLPQGRRLDNTSPWSTGSGLTA
jgi:nitroimidazol reductase NimA-like FMN-containing flavoprotein (pyridoxamine 5'-phosphate oxidase superfamily)